MSVYILHSIYLHSRIISDNYVISELYINVYISMHTKFTVTSISDNVT